MRVSVDRDRCVAHGQCEYTDPEHFSVNEAGVLELDENPPDSAKGSVLAAVSACPARALSAEN